MTAARDPAPIASHKLRREHSGSAEMATITPTCTCGWRGIGYAAYNDYQHTMVREQEGEHLRGVASERDRVLQSTEENEHDESK